MKIEQAIQILKDHNKWRRFDSIDLKTSDPQMAHPRELGIAIDTVVYHFETQNIVNHCKTCGIKIEYKVIYCDVCNCRGNEAYKE